MTILHFNNSMDVVSINDAYIQSFLYEPQNMRVIVHYSTSEKVDTFEDVKEVVVSDNFNICNKSADINKLLDTMIRDTDLSVRVQRAFLRKECEYVRDIVRFRYDEVKRLEYIGKKSLDELFAWLRKNNLELGMDRYGV